MPVVINEIVFKATVADSGREDAEARPGERLPAADREALIAGCVAEVMKLLERERER